MLERMTVKFSSEERIALQDLAQHEVRDFRDQARIIIREELERRGLLHIKHLDAKVNRTLEVGDG